MVDTLVINSTPVEVRVALLEHGTPVEVHIERPLEKSVVGNIYHGRVARVLPGMQAAFVEIGLERTAFLYVNDAILRPAKGLADHAETEPANTDQHDLMDTDPVLESKTSDEIEQTLAKTPIPGANIADILKAGQHVLVQVQKEPLGQKGARITCHITLPGRFLVFLPFSEHIGISHRIEKPEDIERLRNLITSVRPSGCGFIVRTAALDTDSATLLHEANMLIQLWQHIRQKQAQIKPPRLVFADLDLVLRAMREFFSPDIQQVVVDNPTDYQRVRDFVTQISPGLENRVIQHKNKQPIFDHFGIEIEIARALEKKVWLKSGGYIVIDQTEALTVVDVNSGRYVGKNNLEDTIAQINLEAVKEVAYQLRLRNIGGIVIIDFIDMARLENRKKVRDALEEALSRDKAKTTLVSMSEIGLVEMTRKRVRESLGELLTESCNYCQGRSFVKSQQTMANELLRDVVRSLNQAPTPLLLVNMQPEIARYLYAHAANEMARIEKAFNTSIAAIGRAGFHREHYKIVNPQLLTNKIT